MEEKGGVVLKGGIKKSGKGNVDRGSCRNAISLALGGEGLVS